MEPGLAQGNAHYFHSASAFRARQRKADWPVGCGNLRMLAGTPLAQVLVRGEGHVTGEDLRFVVDEACDASWHRAWFPRGDVGVPPFQRVLDGTQRYWQYRIGVQL